MNKNIKEKVSRKHIKDDDKMSSFDDYLDQQLNILANQLEDMKQNKQINTEPINSLTIKQSLEIEIKTLTLVKQQYSSMRTKQFNHSNINTLNRKQIVEKIVDLLYFSKLAFNSLQHSEILANFYKEHISGETRVMKDITYGEEQEQLRKEVDSVLDEDSLLAEELSRADKSFLNQRIQMQILELDEDSEEIEGVDDLQESPTIMGKDEEEKEEVESIEEVHGLHRGKKSGINQILLQNYDGDSEKSHTENEAYAKSEQKVNNTSMNNNKNNRQISENKNTTLTTEKNSHTNSVKKELANEHVINKVSEVGLQRQEMMITGEKSKAKSRSISSSSSSYEDQTRGNEQNAIIPHTKERTSYQERKAEKQEPKCKQNGLQLLKRQGSRGTGGYNHGVNYKSFRRYKQNRYREERITYERRIKPTSSENKESQAEQKILLNNAYESDITSHEPHLKRTLTNNNHSDHHQNNTDASPHLNSSNHLNYNSNTSNNNFDAQITHEQHETLNHVTKNINKKHNNPNPRRHNPYKNNNDYETDREKEQESKTVQNKNERK